MIAPEEKKTTIKGSSNRVISRTKTAIKVIILTKETTTGSITVTINSGTATATTTSTRRTIPNQLLQTETASVATAATVVIGTAIATEAITTTKEDMAVAAAADTIEETTWDHPEVSQVCAACVA